MEEQQKTKIYINYNEELEKYDLDGKWNDYIAVQKEVLRVLRADEFFNNNVITNKETGMQITISPKDIRETLGNGNKFQRLPKDLKEYKVVTINGLKEIIVNAWLEEDNVANIHIGREDKFAYFRNIVIIDNKKVLIRISVKKKVGSNHFHIHHIDINKKDLELLGPSRKTDILEIQDLSIN